MMEGEKMERANLDASFLSLYIVEKTKFWWVVLAWVTSILEDESDYQGR